MKRWYRDAPLMCAVALSVLIGEAPDLLGWLAVHHPLWIVYLARAAAVVNIAVSTWNRVKTDPIGGLRQEAEQAAAVVAAAAKTKDGE